MHIAIAVAVLDPGTLNFTQFIFSIFRKYFQYLLIRLIQAFILNVELNPDSLHHPNSIDSILQATIVTL